MGSVEKKKTSCYKGMLKEKNKWYAELFRRVLNVTLLNTVTWGQNIDRKVANIKLRVGLVQSLLVRCSKEHKMMRSCADDNTVARLTEGHIPREVPPAERKSEPATDMGKDEKQCIVAHIVN
jgi:hypothetical protein